MDTYNIRTDNGDDLNKQQPCLQIRHASFLFSLAAFSVLVIGSRAQQKELLPDLLITQAVLLTSSILLLAVLRVNIPQTLRLNRVSRSNILLVIAMMPFALVTVGLLNVPYILLINKIFGKTLVSAPPVPDNLWGLVTMILIIAGAAGICEEVVFRGIIMRGYQGAGIVPAIVVSSVLFGLMHFDFQKLFATGLLGLIIAFVVYRTNSLFTGMIAHFMNNATALVFSFVVNKIQLLYEDSLQTPEPAATPEVAAIAVIIFMAIGIILFVLLFMKLLSAFIRNTKDVCKHYTVVKKEKLFPGALWLIPGLLLIGIVYVAFGLTLLGIDTSALTAIFKALVSG